MKNKKTKNHRRYTGIHSFHSMKQVKHHHGAYFMQKRAKKMLSFDICVSSNGEKIRRLNVSFKIHIQYAYIMQNICIIYAPVVNDFFRSMKQNIIITTIV